MTLATYRPWAYWWTAVFLSSRVPEWAPSLDVTRAVSSTFALFGLLTALFSLRAKLAWILITLVPLLANCSLLAIPYFVDDLDWLAP